MTVVTCVCCSMISDTQMRYGSRLRFHGRVLRPWRSYHASTRRLRDGLLMTGQCLHLDRGGLDFLLQERFHQPGADHRRDEKVGHHLGGVVQPRAVTFGGYAPAFDGIAEVAERRIADHDDVVPP